MKNNIIKPINHKNIDKSKVYSVIYKDKSELCHILYAYPRKNMFYDDDDNLTGEFEWVAHKIGYVPINPSYIDILRDSVRIEAVHICCGRFTIQEVI